MHRWQAVRRRIESLVRVLGSERPFTRRADLVLLLVLLVPSAFATGTLETAPVAWLTACLLIAAAVVVQRTAPLLSLLLAALLTLFYPWFGANLWPSMATVVLSCLAGRRLTRLWPAHLVFLCVAAAGLLLVATVGQGKDWLSLLMTEFVACVLPWWAGNWWSQRTALTHAGWEHAEQLEWRQRYIADQARMKERARIAQDIHDSLGHELSVMALLAGGLELAPGLSDPHRESVGQLRERCTMATERLHEVIGLLREDPNPSLTPADESVAQLVRRFQRSGTPVRFQEDGARDRPGTPLLSDLAAYRVVQEALTNAAKHAPGAPIDVRVTHTADETVVSVVNERPERGGSVPAAGSGSGLIGLDERVRLAGGTLRTGPRAGGFEVYARLPRGASSPSRSTEPPGPADGDGTAGGSGDGTAPGAATAGNEGRAAAAAADLPAPSGPWRSASRAALLRTRARIRRDARRAALIPAVLGAAIVAFLGGLYVFTSATTSLAPEDYARIRVGETRADLAPALPERRIKKPPPVTSEPSVPAGTTCEYYRASSGLLDFGGAMYRLCFKDDVLMAKDTL
ncbi:MULTISPECIES: histidine kinase [Streptomyces]|uniref:histidine kinase n=3 Tax=Streptomyces TaxID=1883 RepID=Q7AKM4_STRCO|nr:MULTISPECIES: histidine kinase [Streptomyces]AAB08052.1 AbsA1 [Streptomyces coelicolor]MDX2924884.1 histidine kinase [Streptomyces sp. NRRL_B-16638]MDX3409467.1 histidine kinase [Streptomyces sp. ME02-6977A]MYU42748.1 two-component sensor histidine kinase [Streptomyces sp. SID7813]QFI43293.1 two-component sensor histidine kinase [Streptomyces coelicolor A3(2)]